MREYDRVDIQIILSARIIATMILMKLITYYVQGDKSWFEHFFENSPGLIRLDIFS